MTNSRLSPVPVIFIDGDILAFLSSGALDVYQRNCHPWYNYNHQREHKGPGFSYIEMTSSL